MIETRHTFVIGGKLVAAAFGDRPGTWPLPTAVTPEGLWLRAVAAGGQGRYGSADGPSKYCCCDRYQDVPVLFLHVSLLLSPRRWRQGVPMAGA